MKFQVNRYVDSCEICERSKGHEKHYALKPFSVPSGPWEDISYDFIVKFPKCQGNDSILVVVDRFSKMMHLIPCKETATAEDVAQMFLQHVWKLHGTPKRGVSDRGPTFVMSLAPDKPRVGGITRNVLLLVALLLCLV